MSIETREITMARFFELLGAPLRNTRWSWGAQRSDGAVFLRQWENDVLKEADGREYVQIAHRDSPPGPRQHGWRERLSHIAAIRGGVPCFVVMVAAQDTTVSQKSVKSFDARSIVVGGELVFRDGRTYVEVLERRPVSAFVDLGAAPVSVSADERIFRARELKGSRVRCLMATSLPRGAVADFLTQLVAPHAVVAIDDVWRPSGFFEPDEAKLGESLEFLSPEHRETVTDWWLKISGRANVPNWDMVSTCRFGNGELGLIVVEAKAHAAELHAGGKPSGNAANETQIRAAILEANDALGGADGGWALSVERNYQLSNRFAWAWKIASLGVPTALVYLGFLDADEMSGKTFNTAEDWRNCVLAHAGGTVPESAWERPSRIGSSVLVPLIRAARVSADVVPLQTLGS